MTMSRFKDAAIDAGREKPASGQSELDGRLLAIPAAASRPLPAISKRKNERQSVAS
jgi:hypothetical protein